MSSGVYRYTFKPEAAFAEVEASLLLAILAAESLHGQPNVRLEVSYTTDAEKRSCVIDACTSEGKDVNRLFVGFLSREFGEDSFEVRRDESYIRAHA